MKTVSMMIKPASSLCNMRCKYCFYGNVSDLREVKSYGIMTSETVDAMLGKCFQYLEEGDHLNLAFQGGEPTLAGVSFFYELSQKINVFIEKNPIYISYSLQTNGLALEEGFFQCWKEHGFLIGLSLDFNKDTHNYYRVDSKGNGTFSQILATKKRLEKEKIPFNILCVLSHSLSKHPNKLWKEILKSEVKFIQFIPCLEDLDETTPQKHSLHAKDFARFYTVLLPLWFQELQKGNYISIRFFDDLFQLLLNHQVNSCGFTGNCGIQMVVEADGSVYPCDFFVLDKWKLGDFHNNSLEEMLHSSLGQEFLNERSELPELCQNCRFRNFCGGGCRRMEKAMYVQDDFCGYFEFLSVNQIKIEEIIAYLQKYKL